MRLSLHLLQKVGASVATRSPGAPETKLSLAAAVEFGEKWNFYRTILLHGSNRFAAINLLLK